MDHAMDRTLRQTWAFMFRGYHLTRRYISWVIVFNFYALTARPRSPSSASRPTTIS